MRLTRSDKDAFVEAVMDDVPQIDYDEQARSLVKAYGLSTVPEELRPFVKTHSQFFDTHYVDTPRYVCGVYAIIDPDRNDIQLHAPELWAKLVELGEAAKAQEQARSELERKVKGLIETCSTLKAAKERLPEFEKYLPAERGGFGTANLPVANTVAELINAGWPKGEQACAS